MLHAYDVWGFFALLCLMISRRLLLSGARQRIGSGLPPPAALNISCRTYDTFRIRAVSAQSSASMSSDFRITVFLFV